MIEERSLAGLQISYGKDETISITEFLGRGASCSTYKGYHLDSDGNRKNIVIVKEFVPNKEEYNFNINVSGEPISPIEIQDKVFKHRYLPAKTAEFKRDFDAFFKRQEQVQTMVNNILNSDTNKRYLGYNIVSLNEQDIIKEFDENSNTYKGILIFNYDSKDFGNGIKDLSIIERLEAFLCLCRVVNAFHKANIALIDIKPENFVYISEKDASPMTYLKFFDFDSFIYLNEEYLMIDDDSSVVPCGTFPFEAPELTGAYREYRIYDDVGARSDVYSLGIILYNFMIYDVINEYKEFNAVDEFNSLINSENKFLAENSQNTFTDGFIQKLFSILNKACYRHYKERYENEYVSGLSKDVEILLDIYQNKGVHPEIMLDNARNIATEFNNELKDFDESLLCDCVKENE